MELTAKQWLYTIKKGIVQQKWKNNFDEFELNANSYDPENERMTLHYAIEITFMWDKSPEGHDYWDKIQKEMEEYPERFLPTSFGFQDLKEGEKAVVVTDYKKEEMTMNDIISNTKHQVKFADKLIAECNTFLYKPKQGDTIQVKDKNHISWNKETFIAFNPFNGKAITADEISSNTWDEWKPLKGDQTPDRIGHVLPFANENDMIKKMNEIITFLNVKNND